MDKKQAKIEKAEQKKHNKLLRKERRMLSKNRKNSPIGGQAVMEGVMMKGTSSMAVSVRDADGIVRVETKRFVPIKEKNIFFRIPIIRGVVNFFAMMVMGVKTLLRSAEVYGEEEPTKFEKWLAEKFKINLMSVIIAFALIVALGLSVGMFILLPGFLTQLIADNFEIADIYKSLIDGGIRLVIFVIYIASVSLLKDIKRVFMYHGAEHRTINCYELGKELTVENVQSCSTLHQRCGTTFLFFVMLISILVFSFISWDALWINMLCKLALLPVVAGLSYELLKLLAKTNSPLVLPLKAPGLFLQKLTTRKPDDLMVEVAIMSFKEVLEMDNDKTIPEKVFELPKKRKEFYDELKAQFDEKQIDTSDLDWIFCHVLKLKRSELHLRELVTVCESQEILRLVGERLSGKPLQHILGDTVFYGIEIKTDSRALIPRIDTEILCEHAIKASKQKAVLDLCTGTGCLAIAVSKLAQANVVAVDISDDALTLAKENAEKNDVKIEFIKSDMFENLAGRKFDVIVSNPPYIKTEEIETLSVEVKDFEPHLALDGGKDGLDFYRIIAKECKNYLNKNGVLLLEVGINQAQDVVSLFDDVKRTDIIKDYCGVDRVVVIEV